MLFSIITTGIVRMFGLKIILFPVWKIKNTIMLFSIITTDIVHIQIENNLFPVLKIKNTIMLFSTITTGIVRLSRLKIIYFQLN